VIIHEKYTGVRQNDSNVYAYSTRNCTGAGWIGGGHYNAMVHPFTVGPMALSGFAW
jgi:hypothetical protein